MKYGLELANAGACGDARTLGELAALAEASGWDGVFLEDYIVHWSGQNSGTYDPWVGGNEVKIRMRSARLSGRLRMQAPLGGWRGFRPQNSGY